MKRILIVDPLSFKGHVNYNYGVIKSISLNYEYDIIVNEHISNKLIEKGVPEYKFIKIYPDKWNIDYLSKNMSKILYHILFRLFFLKIIFWTYFNDKKYDFVLFTSIEIYSFTIFSFLFNKKYIIIDHGIGNVFTNKYYRKAWKLCNDNISLIVLEEFIKDAIIEKLPLKKIFVVKHPLPTLKNVNNNTNISNELITIFAPSNSNNKEYINSLLNMNLSNNIRIFVKSNGFEYKRENMIITNQYISSKVYEEYMFNSQFILLPYDPTYNYRISAVLFEAIILNKKILLLNNNTLNYYFKIFPNNIILIDYNDNLESVVNSHIYSSSSSKPNLELYQSEAISNEFVNIFN